MRPAVGPVVLAVLAVTALLSSPAVAQAFLAPGDVSVSLEPGGTETVSFTVKNAVNRTVVGFARMEGDLARGAEPAPAEFRVPAGGSREVAVTIRSEAFERGTYHGRLSLVLVNQESGATQRLHANLTADVPSPLLLFGVWEGRLPAPLHGPLGFFAVEASLWLVGAFVVMKLNHLIFVRAMADASRRVRRRVITRVDTPVYVTVVISGVRYAWRFLPDEGMSGAVSGLLSALLVVAIAFLIYRVIDSVLVYYKEQVAPRTETKWDDVVIPVLRKLVLAMVAAAAFFFALQGFGLDLSFLIAGGLVVGLVLSAALGPTLANLFSGLFLMMDRPFVEGDDIRLESGEVCNVRRIGLRSTKLYYYRNHELIIVPNQQLESSRVVNLMYPDQRYKMHLVVGVAYGSPVQLVTELLANIAEGHADVLKDEGSRPTVLFDEFGDSALLFRLVVFVDDVRERFRIASELRYAIDAAFRESGITIPFPQRTVWMHGA